MALVKNGTKQKSAAGGKFANRLLSFFAMFALAFLLPLFKLDLSEYTKSYIWDNQAPWSQSVSSLLMSNNKNAGGKYLLPTIIYNDTRDVPNMTSSGPILVNPQIAGGLYEFNNVCLNKHASSSYLRGLVYFAPQDEPLMANKKRCATCSAPLNHPGGWNGTGRDEKGVGHKCGFECMHASFASSVDDWNTCMEQPEVQKQLNVWGQNQSPARAKSVHYFKDPVYLLNFRSENIGHSLFDTMLVWLPHWDYYKNKGQFPFKGILSDSLEGCLSTNDSFWFCEILRAMKAFGNKPRELPPKPDNTTLYCYESLFVSHVAAQRQIQHPEWLPKRVFDSFRDVLFEEYKLPRRRSYHLDNSQKNEAAGSSRENKTKRILFYAHEPSGRRVWNGMNDLIKHAKVLPKFHNLHFDVIRDFNLPIEEQARLFNDADAHVMVHGAQMANSIFSVDGTFFVEIGCNIPMFISNPKFLKLIGAEYRAVQNCRKGAPATEACLVCEGKDYTYGNFTMKSDAFESLMDEVLKKLDES